MKPNGIDLIVTAEGLPSFRVTRPTPTEDAIWNAVESAFDDGMSAEKFRRETVRAWEHYSREKLKSDLDRFTP